MVYILDPAELLEAAIERQMDLVDEDNTYPCTNCGRRFNVDTMMPTSSNPAAPLICGRPDCEKHATNQI